MFVSNMWHSERKKEELHFEIGKTGLIWRVTNLSTEKKMMREGLISSSIFDDDTKYPLIFSESEIVAFSEMNEKFVFERITILAERDGVCWQSDTP